MAEKEPQKEATSQNDGDRRDNEGTKVPLVEKIAPEEEHVRRTRAHRIDELEKISPNFRFYKFWYITSYVVVELVIIMLTLFTFPWDFFYSPLGSATFSFFWLIFFVIANVIINLLFYIIRKAYYYIALGKKP